MSMRNTLTDEEHRQMVESFVGRAPALIQAQDDRRNRLFEILMEADAADLIARATLTYLHIDPDTFKEWESDRSPAHVEYLALQTLGVGASGPKDVDAVRQAELTWSAIELVREMFSDASLLMVMEAAKASLIDSGRPTTQYRAEDTSPLAGGAWDGVFRTPGAGHTRVFRSFRPTVP